MNRGDDARSLSDEATFAGAKPKLPRDDLSLGDGRTLGGGGDAVGIDTAIADIEVVDLEARYKIEGTLGQGGMGAVLLATDTRLGRKVAIKRILGEAAGNKTAVARFLTEAKAIAALNHPNIVQIYDHGRAKDGPFLTMEFVDGGCLLERCKQGPIPPENVVELACQICDGLAKAHDGGIIHRDIKPANILLTSDGVPKLTDFGLAKSQGVNHGHGVTGTNAVMGTPGFMPPEQQRDAAEVDHRSDLWSLAATVYQMVTGRSPLIIRINEVPVALREVLGKALEEAKNERYQSARDFRDALKTSLRAAAPAAGGVAGEQGMCPACGAANESSRKFCRGCGGALEAPCLKCGKPMPTWEEICGMCGARQSPLAEERRQVSAAGQAEAEGLLGDCDFDSAVRVAKSLREEPHPRLSSLNQWVKSFLGEVERSRNQQFSRASASLAAALKHEAVHDYEASRLALEGVPQPLRSITLAGAPETVASILKRVEAKCAESRRLDAVVRERIAAKALDGLIPELDSLLELRPDRRDVRRVRAQLVDRLRNQEQARDEALKQAAALVDRHDYEGAVAALAAVAPAVMTAAVTQLRKRAESLASEANDLAAFVRKAETGWTTETQAGLDRFLTTINRYLELKPGDTRVVALRQAIVAREEDRKSLQSHVLQLLAEHRHQEAATCLSAMPPDVECPSLLMLRSKVQAEVAEMEKLRQQIRAAVNDEKLDDLPDVVRHYLRLNPKDAEVRSLLQKLDARAENIEKAFEGFSKRVGGLLDSGDWRGAKEVLAGTKPRRNEEKAYAALMKRARHVWRTECSAARETRSHEEESRAEWMKWLIMWGGGCFACGLVGLGINAVGTGVNNAVRYFLPQSTSFASFAPVCWLVTYAAAVPLGLGLLCVEKPHGPGLFFFQFVVMAACFAGLGYFGADMLIWSIFMIVCLMPWALVMVAVVPFMLADFRGLKAQEREMESVEWGGLGADGDAEPPARVPPARPSTASGFLVRCPDCGDTMSPQRLATHLATKCNARKSANGWGDAACPRCGERSFTMHSKKECPHCRGK